MLPLTRLARVETIRVSTIDSWCRLANPACATTIEEVEVNMVSRQRGIFRILCSWTFVMYYMAYTLLLGFSKRGIRGKQPH